MTRNLIVDGTRDVIADGRATPMHVIANKTDYTANRIVGYAVTLEDAALFAAAEEMRDACILAQLWLSNCVPVVEIEGPKPLPILTEALSKSETR